LHIGQAGETISLTFVALPTGDIISNVADRTSSIISITIVTISWLTQNTSGGKTSVTGSALITRLHICLTSGAVEVLASYALIVDELVATLTG
jgi:hypothetical protein